MRVVSLLPSATEVLCRLLVRQPGGLAGRVQLVGRSHECDFPAAAVAHLPILTSQRTTFTTAKDVDDQVRAALHSGESLYFVDEQLLRQLKPDVILTQSLCSVCSIDLSVVENIVESMQAPKPKIISLNPTCLDDVIASIRKVGEGVALVDEAAADQQALKARIERCKAQREDLANRTAGRSRIPNIAFIEWTDPLYVGGHWTPELLRLAGGMQRLNDVIGRNSFAISAEALVEDNPDMLIVCPCGLALEETKEMVRDMEKHGWWRKLSATQEEKKVALVDGNQFFNRPGPRLVDCLEWLTWLIGHAFGAESATEKPLAAAETSENAVFSNPDFAWEWYSPAERDQVGSASEIQNKEVFAKDTGVTTGVGLSPEIEECHRRAVEQGAKTYIDPETGYTVFTELASRERGYCCGRGKVYITAHSERIIGREGCRHCTYGHWNVTDPSLRKNHITRPTLLCPEKKRRKDGVQVKGLHVVFWSGGKDSFLSLLRLLKEGEAQGSEARHIVLLTTFDPARDIVTEQEIPLSEVMSQAKSLKHDLMVVPLPKSCPNTLYVDTIEAALKELRERYKVDMKSMDLVFGDLHLEDIKQWREGMFKDYEMRFPVFGAAYETLAEELFHNDYIDRIEVSNVTIDTELLKKADPFDHNLFHTLLLQKETHGIDAFGELGEFHTKCIFKPAQP